MSFRSAPGWPPALQLPPLSTTTELAIANAIKRFLKANPNATAQTREQLFAVYMAAEKPTKAPDVDTVVRGMNRLKIEPGSSTTTTTTPPSDHSRPSTDTFELTASEQALVNARYASIVNGARRSFLEYERDFIQVILSAELNFTEDFATDPLKTSVPDAIVIEIEEFKSPKFRFWAFLAHKPNDWYLKTVSPVEYEDHALVSSRTTRVFGESDDGQRTLQVDLRKLRFFVRDVMNKIETAVARLAKMKPEDRVERQLHMKGIAIALLGTRHPLTARLDTGLGQQKTDPVNRYGLFDLLTAVYDTISKTPALRTKVALHLYVSAMNTALYLLFATVSSFELGSLVDFLPNTRPETSIQMSLATELLTRAQSLMWNRENLDSTATSDEITAKRIVGIGNAPVSTRNSQRSWAHATRIEVLLPLRELSKVLSELYGIPFDDILVSNVSSRLMAENSLKLGKNVVSFQSTLSVSDFVTTNFGQRKGVFHDFAMLMWITEMYVTPDVFGMLVLPPSVAIGNDPKQTLKLVSANGRSLAVSDAQVTTTSISYNFLLKDWSIQRVFEDILSRRAQYYRAVAGAIDAGTHRLDDNVDTHIAKNAAGIRMLLQRQPPSQSAERPVATEQHGETVAADEDIEFNEEEYDSATDDDVFVVTTETAPDGAAESIEEFDSPVADDDVDDAIEEFSEHDDTASALVQEDIEEFSDDDDDDDDDDALLVDADEDEDNFLDDDIESFGGDDDNYVSSAVAAAAPPDTDIAETSDEVAVEDADE